MHFAPIFPENGRKRGAKLFCAHFPGKWAQNAFCARAQGAGRFLPKAHSGSHIQLFVCLAKVHENLQDFDQDEHRRESQRRRDDQVQSNKFGSGGGEAFDGLDGPHQGVREASGGIAEEKVGGGVILKADVAGGGR